MIDKMQKIIPELEKYTYSIRVRTEDGERLKWSSAREAAAEQADVPHRVPDGAAAAAAAAAAGAGLAAGCDGGRHGAQQLELLLPEHLPALRREPRLHRRRVRRELLLGPPVPRRDSDRTFITSNDTFRRLIGRSDIGLACGHRTKM